MTGDEAAWKEERRKSQNRFMDVMKEDLDVS